MGPRRATSVLAWSLFALWAAVAVGALWVGVRESGGSDSFFAFLAVGYAGVGALVAARHPENAVGWLLLGIALTVGVQLACEAYLASRSSDYAIVAWVAALLVAVWFYVALVFLPLLFPTGRVPSPRWRIVWWFDLASLLFVVVVTAFTPGDLSVNVRVDNPIRLHGTPLDVIEPLGRWVTPVSLLAVLLSAIALVLRFRRSVGAERQQLKWFAAATILVVASFTLTSVEDVVDARWAQLAGEMGWGVLPFGVILAIPLATGFAILRYRLYDIDVVINRTLVYGALTAALAATYVVSILLLRALLNPVTGKSDLAVAGSTLVVAAMFRPARARIQGLVDRRFYRHRYDAALTLDAFASQLRHELDLDAVGEDLRAAVGETMQPAHVSLWLRGD